MTESKSESNTSNGIPELITDVQNHLRTIDYTNRDLVALTVEVETLREDLADTLTKSESTTYRRGLQIAFVGGIWTAVQVTDAHIETCRINPIIHRFQFAHGLSHKQELLCDISFPTHNHGQLREVGHGFHEGNYIGIALYSVLAILALLWWGKSKLTTKRERKNRAIRDEKARETAKAIYNGEMSHNYTRGVVDDLAPKEKASQQTP